MRGSTHTAASSLTGCSRRVCWVADDDAGTVAGFIVVGPADGEASSQSGEVYSLNVDPDRWGIGVGTALLDASTQSLTDASFTDAVQWVHPSNERGRRFYERAGWSVEGAERTVDVLGVTVPEVRYRRPLH